MPPLQKKAGVLHFFLAMTVCEGTFFLNKPCICLFFEENTCMNKILFWKRHCRNKYIAFLSKVVEVFYCSIGRAKLIQIPDSPHNFEKPPIPVLLRTVVTLCAIVIVYGIQWLTRISLLMSNKRTETSLSFFKPWLQAVPVGQKNNKQENGFKRKSSWCTVLLEMLWNLLVSLMHPLHVPSCGVWRSSV